jgi:hypothetical protein
VIERAGLVPVMELPRAGAIRAGLEADGEISATTICGWPHTRRRQDSFLSPITNASFEAYRG